MSTESAHGAPANGHVSFSEVVRAHWELDVGGTRPESAERRFRQLLASFEAETGVPALINTSLCILRGDIGAMASLVRPTAGRAVHLRITPRPSNLGESREILRLISQFGEVEYFRNLKYDALSMPNASLVIFKDEEAASHCSLEDTI